MENNPLFTLYDELMQTKEQQMIKCMIPYLEQKQQKNLFYILLYMQIKQSQKLFSNSECLQAQEITTPGERRCAMLNSLREYCSPKERETVDTLLNLFCILDNYETIWNDSV